MLMRACLGKNISLVKLFLSRGANVHLQAQVRKSEMIRTTIDIYRNKYLNYLYRTEIRPYIVPANGDAQMWWRC